MNANVTMMVLIAKLTGNININKLFPLLPITRINYPLDNVTKKKFPVCGIRGAIISARYKGVCRGLEKNTFFMNNIIIDLCNGEKNINIKLSSNTMHICGCKSIEVAKDAVELLLQIIYYINDVVKIYKQYNYMNYIIELTKGELTDNGHLINTQYTNNSNVGNDTFAAGDVIVNYFLELAKDFVYHEDFVKQLEWINEIEDIISEPKLSYIEYVVVNYGYNLGFEVDRKRLCELINGYDNFIASYENEIEHKVNILLPYDEATRNRKSHHKFIVHRSGYVKQSSPNISMAQDAFHKFVGVIQKLRNEIELKQH